MSLHRRHAVPIVDPGVKIQDGYNVYAAGLEANAFIKFGPTGERGDAPTDFVVGKVWPKLVNYPDWTHPNTSTYWSSEISTFRDVVRGRLLRSVGARWHRLPLTIACAPCAPPGGVQRAVD